MVMSATATSMAIILREFDRTQQHPGGREDFTHFDPTHSQHLQYSISMKVLRSNKLILIKPG